MLPQEPRRVQTRSEKVLTDMLTPVRKERRLTAKSEPIPDRAETKKDLKKCPELSITARDIIAASPITIQIIKEYSGIVFFAVCTEYFSAGMKLAFLCFFDKKALPCLE